MNTINSNLIVLTTSFSNVLFADTKLKSTSKPPQVAKVIYALLDNSKF